MISYSCPPSHLLLALCNEECLWFLPDLVDPFSLWHVPNYITMFHNNKKVILKKICKPRRIFRCYISIISSNFSSEISTAISRSPYTFLLSISPKIFTFLCLLSTFQFSSSLACMSVSCIFHALFLHVLFSQPQERVLFFQGTLLSGETWYGNWV